MDSVTLNELTVVSAVVRLHGGSGRLQVAFLLGLQVAFIATASSVQQRVTGRVTGKIKQPCRYFYHVF